MTITDAADRAHALALVLEFETLDTESLAARIESTLDEARTRDPRGAAAIMLVAPESSLILHGAGVPMRVGMLGLRRCLAIAFGNGEGADHYASTTN